MWPPKGTHTCTRTHKYTHTRHHDTAGAASAAPGHYSVITWLQQPNYIQILCPRCLQVRPSVRLCVRQSFCPHWSSCSSCVPLRPPLCHVCKHPRVSWGLFVTPGTAAVTVCCLLQSVLALIKTSWPAATHHIYSHNDAHAQLRQSALIRWAKNMQTSMY